MGLSRILISVLAAIIFAGSLARAQEADAPAAPAVWQVSKSSGDVWLTSAGVQPASLTNQASLKPGDSIRTGRNGRVLLVRGQETILIAPNSAVTLPAPKDGQADGSSTTILQQAGSILLEVDKRKVRNFEVETPYLVAAVKGTQFRVSVNRGDAHVDVYKGSVEVADVKSGRYALVLPGQSAKVATHGGLSLGGAGVLGPIQQGDPRPTSVPPLPVPSGGLSAPDSVPDGQQMRALGSARAEATDLGGNAGALRISVPLGEVKLDIQKVTNGLAHDASATNSRAAKSTVWSSGGLTPGNGVGKTYNAGNNGSGSGAGSANGAGAGNGNAGGAANAGGNGIGNGNGGGNGIGSPTFGQSTGAANSGGGNSGSGNSGGAGNGGGNNANGNGGNGGGHGGRG